MERVINAGLPPEMWEQINEYVLRFDTPIRLSAPIPSADIQDFLVSNRRHFRPFSRLQIHMDAPDTALALLELAADHSERAYYDIASYFFRHNTFELIVPPFSDDELYGRGSLAHDQRPRRSLRQWGHGRIARMDTMIQDARDHVMVALGEWLQYTHPAAAAIRNLIPVSHVTSLSLRDGLHYDVIRHRNQILTWFPNLNNAEFKVQIVGGLSKSAPHVSYMCSSCLRRGVEQIPRLQMKYEVVIRGESDNSDAVVQTMLNELRRFLNCTNSTCWFLHLQRGLGTVHRGLHLGHQPNCRALLIGKLISWDFSWVENDRRSF